MLRTLVVSAVLAALGVADAQAQSHDSLQTRAIEWSLTATSGVLPYGAADGAYYQLGLRWERSIVRAGRFDMRFAPELVPWARIDRARLSFATAPCPSTGCPTYVIPLKSPASTGYGLMPASLRIDYDLDDGFALTTAARTGLLFFEQEAPSQFGGRPTFLIDGSLGVRWRSQDGRTLRVEWTYTSVSNGGYRLDDTRLRATGVRIGFGTSALAAYPHTGAALSTTDLDTWELSAGAGRFGTTLGTELRADIATIAWRKERLVAGGDRIALLAGMAVLPAVVGRFTPSASSYFSGCSLTNCPGPSTTTFYGVGLAPLAVKARVQIVHAVDIWTDLLVGGVLFDQAYPVSGAGRFNFLLETGAGVSVRIVPDHALIVGARFQHLSNAFTAPQNPGVEVLALALGWSVRR